MNDGIAYYDGHSVVRVQTTDGDRKRVCTCRIGPDDVEDDGRIDWPPENDRCERGEQLYAVGECQPVDSTTKVDDCAIVVGGRQVQLEDVSFDHDGGRKAGIGIGAGQQTYSGSFTVAIEDEETARKIREYFS